MASSIVEKSAQPRMLLRVNGVGGLSWGEEAPFVPALCCSLREQGSRMGCSPSCLERLA